MRLDAVNQLARLAGCGDVVEPAAGKHGRIGQDHYAPGQDIEAAEVVEEPAVETELADGRLNGGQIEHGKVSCWAVSLAAGELRSDAIGSRTVCIFPRRPRCPIIIYLVGAGAS